MKMKVWLLWLIVVMLLLPGCVNAPKANNKTENIASQASSEVKANLTLKQRLLTEGGELLLTISPGTALAGGLQDIDTNAVINLDPANKMNQKANASSCAIPNPGGDSSREFRYVRTWKIVSEDEKGVLIEIYFDNETDGAKQSASTAQVLVNEYKDGKLKGVSL